MLLILRISPQFSGQVWLAYGKAFCEDAAVTRLADWRTMNAQLFIFHAGGASPRSHDLGTSPDSSEPVDSSSSRIPLCPGTMICMICSYYHRCSTCGSTHHSVSCSSRSNHKQESSVRRRSPSPAFSSSGGQKECTH